jgi:uridine kinase
MDSDKEIPQSVVHKLLSHLAKWQSITPRLVVGIEGYSGAGKTTLVKEIVATMPAVLLHMDEFQVSDNERKKLERSLHHKKDIFVEKYRFAVLRDLVEKFRDGQRSAKHDLVDPDADARHQQTFLFDANLLIIDGIWLSNSDRLPSVFDKIVFLDIDPAIADHRRRQREGQRWGADAWEETHPDSYIKQYKLAHEEYMERYKPRQHASLVLKVG